MDPKSGCLRTCASQAPSPPLCGFAALVVLVGAGFDASPIPVSVADWATWVLVALLVLGAAVNFLSRSRLERIVWGPIALVLAGLTAVVASAG